MPELPDVLLYVEHVARRIEGRVLERVRVSGWNLLRTTSPPLEESHGRAVTHVSRSGKRIVISLERGLHLALHLMISGRLHWRAAGAALPKRVGLAAFDFENGSLTLTEASSHQRASLHVVEGAEALRALSAGGLDVTAADSASFAARLREEDHTLKRALTDPRILDGIGNAYSDEILHRAHLSPFRRTRQLKEGELERLREAARAVLVEWTERLRDETGVSFPERVTAFRPGMSVHGRFRKPCPVCGSPVQRVVYAENEMNYCAGCQTGGRLLADRALSRLLGSDWPRSLEELAALEERRRGAD